MGKTEEGHKHLGLSALGFPAWRRFFSLLFFFEACPIPLYMIFFFFYIAREIALFHKYFESTENLLLVVDENSVCPPGTPQRSLGSSSFKALKRS